MEDARVSAESSTPTGPTAAAAAVAVAGAAPSPASPNENEGHRNDGGSVNSPGRSQANPAPPPLAALAKHGGHELPFVAPSSYLRPKPNSHTMSERTVSPLDREQMQGLVSLLPFIGAAPHLHART